MKTEAVESVETGCVSTGGSIPCGMGLGVSSRSSAAAAPLRFGPGRFLRKALQIISENPEQLCFVLLLVWFNNPFVSTAFRTSLMFQPAAVEHGEWWRVLTHPFVHVTWYHLLLDATAFLSLYRSLLEPRIVQRLAYVAGAGAGSLLLSCAVAPALSSHGLCGLSGIAHGLMAVSALELVGAQRKGSVERRIGMISFVLVSAKAAFEAVSGRMFFGFISFGMLGEPVAVSHAGGIVGALVVLLVARRGTPDGQGMNEVVSEEKTKAPSGRFSGRGVWRTASARIYK